MPSRRNDDGPYGVLTMAAIAAEALVVWWYTFRSARRRADRKRFVMDKAKSICRRLDCVADGVVFCHNPVYRFVKHKINAGVEAMDAEDDDRAGECFADALLLVGPNRKVLYLMDKNLPRNVVAIIKRKYEKLVTK